jgi:hypothetical protein
MAMTAVIAIHPAGRVASTVHTVGSHFLCIICMGIQSKGRRRRRSTYLPFRHVKKQSELETTTTR